MARDLQEVYKKYFIMTNVALEMLFEHNNWANLQIVEACSTLTDEQLDAEPKSATRTTLSHLVASQQGFLRLLTMLVDKRLDSVPIPSFDELKQLIVSSGEALLALARDESSIPFKGQLRTRDNYLVEHRVVMV